jgi:4-hydroxy-tetrahydrodipicolinate synthase
MKNTIFRGVGTAIVTPFENDGRTVDFVKFGKLIDWQIEQGVNAIIAAGTSGEGSTLSDAEHREVLKFVVERVNHRVPVVAGTGSNDTAYAIDLSIYACAIGCDALLLVTPYYNKATQEGLYQYFTAVANATDKPCILYNVPSRTGCNLLPETVSRLADHPRIVAIKEACGDISQIAKVAALCSDRLDIYSGNDDQIVPIMSLGGIGVISVLSNIMPKETVELCDSYFAGDHEKARDMQLKYLPLINSLFCEVNPIPVKAAVAAMGYCNNIVRLPLTAMTKANEEKMLNLMRQEGLNC